MARVARWMAGGREKALAFALLCPALAGCPRNPPPSQFPSADSALDRMHQTYACSRGVQGEAKIDYFSDEGRVRGSVLYKAALPEKLRFDVFSPFGVTLSTLTSNGEQFALYDLQQKAFLTGPANACNVARFTRVPVPPFAMAQLLRGEAPVLVHTPQAAQIAWEGGRYVVRIQSKHDARQVIELEPSPDDWQRPWQEQRVRVLEVSVTQQGYDLYRAVLADHEAAATAKPWVDPDGLAPTVMASGPVCDADVPRRMRLEVPDTVQDVVLRSKEVVHNPPIEDGTFRQSPRPGVSVRYSACGG